MDTIRFPMDDGRTAVVAIEQIAAVWQALAVAGEEGRWFVDMKTGNKFRLVDVYGKRIAAWFAGDITLAELEEDFFET